MKETVERLSFPRLQPLSSELLSSSRRWLSGLSCVAFATLAYGGSNEEVGKLHGRHCSAGVFVAGMGQ